MPPPHLFDLPNRIPLSQAGYEVRPGTKIYPDLANADGTGPYVDRNWMENGIPAYLFTSKLLCRESLAKNHYRIVTANSTVLYSKYVVRLCFGEGSRRCSSQGTKHAGFGERRRRLHRHHEDLSGVARFCITTSLVESRRTSHRLSIFLNAMRYKGAALLASNATQNSVPHMKTRTVAMSNLPCSVSASMLLPIAREDGMKRCQNRSVQKGCFSSHRQSREKTPSKTDYSVKLFGAGPSRGACHSCCVWTSILPTHSYAY